MSLYSMKRGKELEDDPEYQARLKDPVWREKILNTTATSLDEHLPAAARNSVLLFILSILTIVVIAMIPEVRIIGEGTKPISMAVVIQMMMLCPAQRAKWRCIQIGHGCGNCHLRYCLDV